MLDLENVINNSKKKLGSLREKLTGENNQGKEISNIINDLDEIISELTVSLDSKISDQDFTERKEAEQKLKSEKERAQKYLDIAGEIIVALNADQTIQLINQKGCEILEEEESKIIGMNWFDNYIPQSVREEVKKTFNRILSGEIKPLEHYENEIITKNGKKRTISWYNHTLKNKTGQIIGTLSSGEDITARKHAELKLKKSEEKYRRLINNLTDIILELDIKGVATYVSPQCYNIMGYQPTEIIGKKVISFIHPDDVMLIAEGMKEAIKTKQVIKIPSYRILHKNRDSIYATATGRYVNLGGMEKFIVAISDDRKRKEAELRLAESEEKFRTITEQSFMGIIIIQDGLFKYLNQRAVDINGYSVEEIQNWKPYEFAKLIHPEDREFVMEQAKKKQIGELDVINRYSYRIIKKSGEIAWLDNFSKSINYKGRNADLVMTEDITDKIIAEQQLKESEEFFRTITEQSLLGIIIIQDGIIKYVNDFTLNYSGFSRDEVINLPETQLLKFIHPEDHDKFNQALIEPNSIMTFRLITKDGNTKWIDIHTKIIYYKGKEAYFMAFLDITEIKEAEQIVKDEIIKLKELDELKSEFVYRASHELKTPLNSIVSASALLIDSYRDSCDERVYSLINVINKGGKRLDDLIEDLLDVSRLESGKITIIKKKEDIVEIIKNCTQDMIFLINKRNLKLDFKYLQERFFIDIDKKRFEQVILNILSNSIKNTPSEGTISINIKSEKTFIDLSITDTGVGFTKKEKEKLFQKFGKIERHGKGMDIITDGTGLGLFISKEIVELHGGEIWVESQGRNKGSTIIIRLPYKK